MSQSEVPIPMGGPKAVPHWSSEARLRPPLAVAPPDAEPRTPAPSGWYPEPARLRFWNGEHWTDAVRLAAPPDAAARVAVLPEVRPMPAPAPAPMAPPVAVEPPPPPPVSPPGQALWAAAPVATAAVVDRQEQEEEVEGARALLHQLAVLMLVVAVAVGAGALVTAFGIALTV